MSHSYRRLQATRTGAAVGFLGLAAASLAPSACHHGEVEELRLGTQGQEGVYRSVPRYHLEGKLPSEALVPVVSDVTEPAPPTRVVPGTLSCADDPVSDLYIANPAHGAESQDLLDRMLTSEQRIIQITGQDKPDYSDNSRWQDIQQSRNDPDLGVRGYQWRDGPHGINLEAGLDWRTGGFRKTAPGYTNYSTSFPTSVAQGATFDVDLIRRMGEAMGDETAASGHNVLLTPCMNLLRNPLWGRAQETFGEDVFHLGRIGTAQLWGLQEHVTGCAKHYIANNIELQRMYINATMDERAMREVYARHFEMVVRDGGVGCMMASYNLVNGKKSTQNHHILTDLLKNDFGFRGFSLTDWWAMPSTNHGQGDFNTVTDSARVAYEAIMAGLDVEVPWAVNYYTLPALLESGEVPWSAVDSAVKRVLEQKIRFNTAYMNSPWTLKGTTETTYDAATGNVRGTEATHVGIAREVAEKGIVLLKNDNQTLPIDPAVVQKVAVIGAKIDYIVESDRPREKVFDFSTDAALGDRGSSRVSPDPLLTVGPLKGLQDAALAAQNGVEVVGGNTVAAVTPDVDFVVVVVGLTAADEGEEYTGAADRETLELYDQWDYYEPEAARDAWFASSLADKKKRVKTLDQNKLVNDVLALGKPTVVVIEAGGAIDEPWLDTAPAVVMAWYPGQRGGEALGRLLFGTVNFSGRLPVTWPMNLAQFPQFTRGDQVPNPMEYHVGYRWFDKNGLVPRYYFGHGLSYTTFEIERLHVPCADVTANGLLQVEVDVRNTGTRAGEEVVFVFASQPTSVWERSPKELKGFGRVYLEPGQVKRVTIPVRVHDMRVWDEEGAQWVIEEGTLALSVGSSSAPDRLPLTTTVQVHGATFQ